MNNVLYLGSKSKTRHQLLQEAQIDFRVVDQDADESECEVFLSMQKTVEAIALYKMQHVILPVGKQRGDICFVLTADTLTQHPDGSLGGKPKNRAEAVQLIKLKTGIMRGGSAFCLDKRVWATIPGKLSKEYKGMHKPNMNFICRINGSIFI